ncbi:MAG: trehalose-phosphatase [Parvibaculaceae bacterium]|nr:trehalose-phosphatase [Parvibaculaceae bacterium]
MSGLDGLPVPSRNWALFLDFDGTLVDLAPKPDLVEVPAGLTGLLQKLSTQLDGALAIVTGRELCDVDGFLRLMLPGAGIHGAELRRKMGDATIVMDDSRGLADVIAELEPLIAGDPRLILQLKSAAFTLHYRLAPERETEMRDLAARAVKGHENLELMFGKMMVEVKPKGADKGTGMERLMQAPPFSTRVPVFIGDDITDEDGFKFVKNHAGLAIKVGDGTSSADHRLSSPAAVFEWLMDMSAYFERKSRR